MCMLIRAHENAARGHIAFSHFGDAALLQFSLHADLLQAVACFHQPRLMHVHVLIE